MFSGMCYLQTSQYMQQIITYIFTQTQVSARQVLDVQTNVIHNDLDLDFLVVYIQHVVINDNCQLVTL